MKASLKNSLFVGLAALGFVTLAGATNASAAATSTGFHDLTGVKANDRNVTFTGKNAIYDKPGTVAGKKQVVASTTTLKKLSASQNSKENFRAYGYTTTDRGSVYYKVVSYDGQYRGYIYGGKKVNSFGGGVAQFATSKDASVNSTEKNKTFVFAHPGDTNDGNSVTYAAPAYTQYKIGRKVMDTTDYKNDKLTITKAATRTREGDRWVYVTDSTHPEVSGWIKSTGVKEYKSNGVNQTTASRVFNYSNYDVAGQKTTSTISNLSGLRLLFNSNVNFTNAINTFNRDTAVKGNKSDILSEDTLVSTLKKDGLTTVYMKITPTIIGRIPGGILDNMDTTGLFMKFNLDKDALPSNVHYGDNIRLSYTVEPQNLYVKAPNQTVIEDNTKNEDGYYAIPMNNDVIRSIVSTIATMEF
ncbi:S-layer protein [Lentilactobacillus kribbianus]|uniref:S-layer protein n=1 Tax=Lentilactobacillus kribbianus TaxID=2729622 RepID=UPI001551A738|nr:S-layer protein [Lentilactobacillus kribbianus]